MEWCRLEIFFVPQFVQAFLSCGTHVRIRNLCEDPQCCHGAFRPVHKLQ
jgi:hypothetical protein